MAGEIKSMDKGILNIETSYSSKDFQVEWDKIRKVRSPNYFLLTFSDGLRINGTMYSPVPDSVYVESIFGATYSYAIADLVYLKGVKSTFWNRIDFDVDMGLNYAKANSVGQFSFRSNLYYQANKWDIKGYLDDIRSSQAEVEAVKRLEGGVNYKYYLPDDWYAIIDLAFLSNTEQALQLRTSGRTGAGNFLKHTNRAYWATGAGLSFNNEQYSNETDSKNSLEAFGGMELNIFDIGDLDLYSSLAVYPSLTTSGRIRTDFKFDFKYDLVKDLYLKLGTTINYDNKPAISGNETDYVFYTNIGWKF
ncbi:MAG: DUF481 domain-containing protein [Saprospiraceae bacterium]|nr:DUF481 domain-containing protein [Saprospiraceae bacterium]